MPFSMPFTVYYVENTVKRVRTVQEYTAGCPTCDLTYITEDF